MSSVSEYFGCLVFDDRVMKATLPLKVYRSLKKTIDEDERLDSEQSPTAPPTSPTGSSR